EVIGIARKDSTWPSDVEFFHAARLSRDPDLLRRDNHIFSAIARLKRGVTLAQAQSQLTVMGARIAQQHVNRVGTNWKLHPLAEYIIGPELRQTLLILMGAALLVLLIACVNVANLLLVRGEVRAREAAIRNALGAGWRRLAAQFLVESALLAAVGGAAGM